MWCVVFKSLRVTLRFIVTVAAIAKEVGTHTCSAAAESHMWCLVVGLRKDL